MVAGFKKTGSNGICTNIDECADGSHSCPETTICHDEIPDQPPYYAKYMCQCPRNAKLTSVRIGTDLISACVCNNGFNRKDFEHANIHETYDMIHITSCDSHGLKSNWLYIPKIQVKSWRPGFFKINMKGAFTRTIL